MAGLNCNSRLLHSGDSVLDPWFVTGFCDGEAAFTFSRCGKQFSLYFSIRQREDNRKVVEQLQRYFHNVGKIYSGKEQAPTKNSGKTQPSAYFRVCKQNDLLRVIEHFDKFPLQSKKQEAYNVWREMAINRTQYVINCNDEIFKAFATKLSSLNQKSRAFKKHTN